MPDLGLSVSESVRSGHGLRSHGGSLWLNSWIFTRLAPGGRIQAESAERQPANNALSKRPKAPRSRDTVGAWLRGDRFPTVLDALLLAGIRAEAARAGLLAERIDGTANETVAELLAEDRWRASWTVENQRRITADRQAAELQEDAPPPTPSGSPVHRRDACPHIQQAHTSRVGSRIPLAWALSRGWCA